MMQPKYKLKVPDSIVETIRTMHPHIKKKHRAALQIIVSDPYTGKALKDDLEGFRSFRLGQFRIIYRISQSNEIKIVMIGPRKKIYEETNRLISKGKTK